MLNGYFKLLQITDQCHFYYNLQSTHKKSRPKCVETQKVKAIGAKNTRDQFPRSETHRGPTERHRYACDSSCVRGSASAANVYSAQDPQQKPPATDYCCI